MASSSFYSATGVTPDNPNVEAVPPSNSPLLDPVAPLNINAIESSVANAKASEDAAEASAVSAAASAAISLSGVPGIQGPVGPAGADSTVVGPQGIQGIQGIAGTDASVTASTVSAVGALMDSEVTHLAQVKAFDQTDYATAAQGTKADTAHLWGNHASAGYTTSAAAESNALALAIALG